MSKTVTLYTCDTCKMVIVDPKGGRVVHGNIYVADPTTRGGLVGNNFPLDNPPGTTPPKFNSDEVKESVYCIVCFLKAVEITVKTLR